MQPQEYGTYKRAMRIGGEARRGWEHKDPSDHYWASQGRKLKGIMGTLGFLAGAKGSVEGVEALEKIVDMPAVLELGLVATGTALLTYLGVKAGKAIVDREERMYRP